MINPKETLRICEAAEAEENTGKLRRVACLNRADYAVEALPEYAAWVKEAVPAINRLLPRVIDDDDKTEAAILTLHRLLERVES